MMNLSSLSKAKICTFITVVFSTYEFARMLYLEGIVWDLLPAIVALGMSAMIQFYIWKLHKSFLNTQSVLTRLRKGDFSARILNITEGGDVGELYHDINDVTDVMDAFVRESQACMQAVNENSYYRRILPEGLLGSLLQGAEIINAALMNVGQKMTDFSKIAHDVDTSLNGVAEEITTTIGVLTETAQNMDDLVINAKEKMYQALKGAENTSHSVDTISAASEEMSVSISGISHQINRSSQISANAVEEAEIAKSRMAELTETVEKISNVVRLIEDIANQTNLLALNATIEAARAGEAGKGFGVVANEVKSLAAQTTSAIEEIRPQILAIQHATKASAQSFDDISIIIDEMNSYTTNIPVAIEEQTEASREITRSSQVAAKGTGEVSQNMGELGDDIQNVGCSAEGVVEIAKSLSQKTVVSVKDLVLKMNVFMGQLNKVAS